MKAHKAYIAAKRVFLEGKWCARCGAPGPIGWTCIIGLAARGTSSSTQPYGLRCAVGCHNWVHLHPKEAIAAGFNAPKGCWNDEKRALKAKASQGKVDA